MVCVQSAEKRACERVRIKISILAAEAYPSQNSYPQRLIIEFILLLAIKTRAWLFLNCWVGLSRIDGFVFRRFRDPARTQYLGSDSGAVGVDDSSMDCVVRRCYGRMGVAAGVCKSGRKFYQQLRTTPFRPQHIISSGFKSRRATKVSSARNFQLQVPILLIIRN